MLKIMKQNNLGLFLTGPLLLCCHTTAKWTDM